MFHLGEPILTSEYLGACSVPHWTSGSPVRPAAPQAGELSVTTEIPELFPLSESPPAAPGQPEQKGACRSGLVLCPIPPLATSAFSGSGPHSSELCGWMGLPPLLSFPSPDHNRADFFMLTNPSGVSLFLVTMT